MKTSNILKQAKAISRSVKSWADLSNALFDPIDGLVSRAYPTRAERAAFVKSEEYAKLKQLVASSTATHDLIEGATPKRSDCFWRD